MLVWGGFQGSYDVWTNTRDPNARGAWFPITLTGAPRGMPRPWCGRGSRMIVWGGVVGSNNQPTNSGGSYDPIRTPGFLRNSSGHRCAMTTAAVWTGNVMIVWGGRVNGIVTKTGDRYDPTTDSWNSHDDNGRSLSRHWYRRMDGFADDRRDPLDRCAL
jgi:hypothetical protein